MTLAYDNCPMCGHSMDDYEKRHASLPADQSAGDMIDRISRIIDPDAFAEGMHGADCPDCEYPRVEARKKARDVIAEIASTGTIAARPAVAAETPFRFPPGVKPRVTRLLNGDVQIVDDIEDAPLVTIRLHNGTEISGVPE